MAAEDRCYFCQRLPALPGRRRVGTAARCPVCKGWLLQTSTQTYRDDGDPTAGERHPGRRLAVAACAVGGFMTLAAVGGLLAAVTLHKPAPLAQREGPPSARAVAVTLPPPSFSDPARPPEEPPAPRKAQPAAPAPKRAAAVRPKLPAEHPALHPAPTAAKPVPAVRPKPAVPPVATAIAAPPTEPNREQAGAGPQAPGARSPWENADTADALFKTLWQAPEISLAVPAAAGRGGAGDGVLAKAAWRELGQTVEKQREKFLDGLLVKRPSLAGLPFRKGKDCRLNGSAARVLDRSSREVRGLLARSLGRGRGPISDPDFYGSSASVTQLLSQRLAGRDYPQGDPALPALEQVLTGEVAPVRLALVQYLRSPSDADATAVLARRAVFDPSAEVRDAAVAALRCRPSADYLPTLLRGLGHAWPLANYHAAEALVALRTDTAVPGLVRALDAPDPSAPFETEEGGKRVWAVRELVRVSHHGSCLLCHAPSFNDKDMVRAPVPDPLEPLPPLAQYYSRMQTIPGRLFVRADVTYLRQDFSEVLPVADPGRWPSHQRFDFLVRVRPLTEGEEQAWRGREQLAGPVSLPASHQAAVFALRQLTGLDGGFTANSWRKALARAGRPGQSKAR